MDTQISNICAECGTYSKHRCYSPFLAFKHAQFVLGKDLNILANKIDRDAPPIVVFFCGHLYHEACLVAHEASVRVRERLKGEETELRESLSLVVLRAGVVGHTSLIAVGDRRNGQRNLHKCYQCFDASMSRAFRLETATPRRTGTSLKTSFA